MRVCVYIYTHKQSILSRVQSFYFPYIHIATKSVVDNWPKIYKGTYMWLSAVFLASFSPCLSTRHYHPKVSVSWKWLLPTVSGFVEFVFVFSLIERRPSVSSLTEPHVNLDQHHLVGSVYKHTHTENKTSSYVFFQLFYYLFLLLWDLKNHWIFFTKI